MYRNEPYTGADLPAKSLCLTYDDGPGKHTYEIAKFLYDQNVRATFFVVGRYALGHQDVLEEVAKLGHLIGNHTYEHPDMPYYLSVNGDVHNQILRTDAIIGKHINSKTIYFRSPYGKWSREVADELNMHMLCTANHIGPIHWDVAGVDCFYWKNNCSVEDTVHKYLSDIKEKDHGIVVMHDDIADMNFLKEKNNTLELTKQLIPLLQLQGYRFVRLDEIESIKEDASKPMQFSLRSKSGKFVCLSESGNGTVHVNGKRNNLLNELSLQELGDGKIALKASNGLFFSLLADKANQIEAISHDIKQFEAFDLVPLSANQIVLRAYNGDYLVKERKKGNRLLASAAYMRQAEIFGFLPKVILRKKNVTLLGRYKSLKKQVLYIKSKIQQTT